MKTNPSTVSAETPAHNEKELLPCPFCGTNAKLIEEDGTFKVECSFIGACYGNWRPAYGLRQAAVERWNQRAHNASLVSAGKPLEQDATPEQLAAVANVPDARLRVELACCSAELEAAHKILDEFEGHKDSTSLTMLMDRLKKYFPAHSASLVSAGKEEIEDVARKFEVRASEWDRTSTAGNKLAASECRLFAETLRKLGAGNKRETDSQESGLNVLRDLQAFIGVMFGVGPDCIIPEKVRTPLGVEVKLGDIMRDLQQLLSSHSNAAGVPEPDLGEKGGVI